MEIKQSQLDSSPDESAKPTKRDDYDLPVDSGEDTVDVGAHRSLAFSGNNTGGAGKAPSEAGLVEHSQSMERAMPGADLVGTTFSGKYEMLDLLGRGGMSVVYRARHIILDKVVAVKVLHLERVRDQLSQRRFKQEAQAASNLNHPGIVAVHDFGESKDGTPYLEMDFVDGLTLSDIIKKSGPLSLERFLSVMQQVAAGLAVAHQNGIVHRDLKPSNIMVSKASGKEQAKILDFGIAKILGQTNENVQQLTQTGEIFGSPLYMSPEQCTGAPVDHRADIYSLGCVMYECLAGKVPMQGDSVFETIHKHINTAPPPLVAEQIKPEFRGKLETILLRCLAKAPADRFQSAQELESELRSLSLKSKPGILSALGGAWEHSAAKRRSARKSKLPLTLVTLMAVSIFSMVSVLTLLSAQQKLNDDLAQLNRSRLILSEVTMAQSDFIKMSNALRIYASIRVYFHGDPARMEYARKRMQETAYACEKSMHKVEALLEDPSYINKYRKIWQKNVAVIPTASKDVLFLTKALDDPSEKTANMHVATLISESMLILDDMTRVARRAEKEGMGQLSGTQEWISYISLLCAALNASVVAVLAVYFARGTPQKLRKLAAQAANLSRRTKLNESSGQDEVADLDNVLHELAAALSEAEEREKLLLQRLREKDGQQNAAELDLPSAAVTSTPAGLDETIAVQIIQDSTSEKEAEYQLPGVGVQAK